MIYLYGIVPADAPDPPAELRGLDDTPVRLVRSRRVAAAVSEVAADVYDEDALNARLDDLAWVGERGLAHERVLDWFAERGPVIPLSLFSIHRDLDRVEGRVGADEEDFHRLLERLSGKREWGVKLWRQEEAAKTGVDRLSPSLQALAKEIDASPPGKRFLLERKREAMRGEEVRAVSKRLAHEVIAALRPLSAAVSTMPIPSDVRTERVLLLHSAFLVADDAFDAFHRAVSEQAGRVAPGGFEIELTGPWPPYHFTDSPDE